MNEKSKSALSGKTLLIVGLILLSTPLFFVVCFPKSYDGAQFFLRLVAALGGSCIGALLPGTIDVDTPLAKGTGALGIFLLVFTFNPSWDVYNSVNENEGTAQDHKQADTAVLPSPPPPAPAPSIGKQSTEVTNGARQASASEEQKVAACVANKVEDYERVKEMSTEGVARTSSPGIRGGTKKKTAEICVSVGPNQSIVAAATENLSCFGNRCSVSAVEYSLDHVRACVTATAWSESKSFGGGGSARYKLIAHYKDVATEEQTHRFRDTCRVGA